MALQDFVTQFVLMQSQRVDVQRHVIVVRRGNFGIRFSLKVAIDLQPPTLSIMKTIVSLPEDTSRRL